MEASSIDERIKSKPKLSVEEQINHLNSKGIRFELISVQEAVIYLKENNNFFKLGAYRKNFPKHPDGLNKGKYIKLDFAMLKDLSVIDMHMRHVFIQMTLDIEHFAKVRLLKAVDDSENNGYQIVFDYFESLRKMDDSSNTHYWGTLQNELARNRNNAYCGGIIAKYDGCYPIWAFLEVVSLGTLVRFYEFCAKELNDKQLRDEYYLLKAIKEIRNAAAHNNCIIHDMGSKDSKHRTNYSVCRALKGISKSSRDSQLANERMRQIVTLLYTHTIFVHSDGIRNHTKKLLSDLMERIYLHIEYYSDNWNILASFDFLKKSVDILFS